MTNDQLAAALAEQARNVAAKRDRHLSRRPPAVPPSPLHRCFCQDPWLPYDHQLGDHGDLDNEDGAE